MPKVFRDGTDEPVDDTDNPVALDYYRREEGYRVEGDEKAATSTPKQAPPAPPSTPAQPAPPAS